MKVKFTTSIASAQWSYACNQVVRTGLQYSPDEIPAESAAAWLNSGVVVPVPEEGPETAMKPTMKPTRKMSARA